MMGATHALAGMLIGLTSLLFFPEMLVYAALGGFIGGIFPDLDLAFEHRKTLHFPVYYTAVTVIASTAMFFLPSQLTVFAAYFLVSAAFHSAVDVFGGGLETRPWIPSSEEGVYSHFHGKWFAPKRWIRYDGSPEDLALTVLLAIPSYLLYNGFFQQLVILTVAAAAVYTIIRKKLVDWAPERLL